MSLKKVRDELRELRGFEVTLSQLEYRCKTKWNFDKYLNKESWQSIDSLRSRDGGGEREVFVREIHIPPRKVEKELKRRGLRNGENVRPTLVTGTSTAELPLELPGLRSCPNALHSDLPDVTIDTLGAEEQGLLVAIGSLGPSEKLQLLSRIINKLLDKCNDRYRYTVLIPSGRITDLIIALTIVISISKVTSMELGSLASLPAAFQDTALRLWYTLFRPRGVDRRKSRIEDDEMLDPIVTWLLAASENHSILNPSIDDAFDQALSYGHTKVALLLEPFKTFSSSPGQLLKTRGIREAARQRTESSLLLMRRIVLNDFPEWRRFILGNLVRYSRTKDLKELLASASAIFELDKMWNDTCFWPHTIIRGILIDCINSHPEDSATEKFNIFVDAFKKMGLVLNATHVDSDVFIAAAQRGYLRKLATVLTINQDLRTADDRGFTALHAAADVGHLEMCKWILQRSPASQSDVDELLSALFVALAKGHFEIVQLSDAQLSIINRRQLSATEWRVLLCSCNRTASHNENPGDYSFRVGKIDIKLGELDCCILCGAAVAASIEGRTSQLQFYLAHGATVSLHPTLSATIDLDEVARPSFTVHYLTWRSKPYLKSLQSITVGSLSARMSCVALLIGSGITPTARDKITSLQAGEWEITQLLDCYGVPIQHDQSRFAAAICGRDERCISETYKSGNPGYNAGALCAAVAFAGHSQFIRKIALGILARRVASDLGSPVESTAIAMAALRDDTELFMKLLSAIPSPHSSCNIRGHGFRVRSTRTEVLQYVRDAILSHSVGGVAPFWHDECRYSLLSVVAICGRPEMLQALLNRGIQRNLAACSMAVKTKCRRSLQVLLRGQPPLRTWAQLDKNDDDPLVTAIKHWDSSRCDFSLISQILSAGADINSAAANALLLRATILENIRLVEFFIRNGADVNARTSDTRSPTALYKALKFGGAGVVQWWLDHGADVNAPPPERSDTCLQLAARRFDFLEMFIDKKVKVDGDHRLDFIIAVSKSTPLSARRLRQYGNWQDEDEDILEIIQSLNPSQRRSRLRIREGVSRELAKREQVEIQEPETSDTAGNMTNADDPRSLGILSPYHPLSEWQFGPGYFRDTAFFTEFHDGSYPLIDMSTPPYSWGDMEICDQEYGPNLMRQRIGDVGAEEEDEIVWLD